ncbi:MAG: FecR family protein [Treponema sp.]|jgi:hypothetical protein|nr:FecR family protein [Treponema sp.]
MQKKRNTKSRAADLLIILLCFAGAGVSGFAFWQEYNRTLVKLNEEPVGLIVFKNRTAHRKIEDRTAWDRLKQESPIYNGDTIRTAEASVATITFEDAVTQVSLYENTLIRVFYDSRGARIDFSGGNLDVNSGGRSVWIADGASMLEVESGGQASVNKSAESFSVSVNGGRANFNGAELESGDLRSFLRDGTPDTGPAVAVTSFGNFVRILGLADGVIPALFTWTAANFDEDTHVIVEVARDREFSRVVQTRDVRGASSVSLPLESGNYWWRVYPVQGDARNVPARGYASGRIEALPAAAVTALAPFPSQELSGETGVPFSWTSVEGADGYRLEISANENMGGPAVSRRVQGSSVVQTGLADGRWYWRVSPVFPAQVKGDALASKTGVFSLSSVSAVPASPALIAPVQNGALGRDHPRLSWKYDPAAAFWTVELADNPSLSNPLLRADTASNFYSLPAELLQEGKTYFWRVTARSRADTARTGVSPVYSFTAEDHLYEQRSVFPPDNYYAVVGEGGGISFTCRSNVPYQNYLQISSQSDFSSLMVNDPMEGRAHTVSELPSGMWYWRIYADGESGPVASAPRRLNVVSGSETPSIAAPSVVRRGETLELEWSSLYFASYRLDVYNADDPGNSVESRITESSSAALPTSSLEPGEYIVSVTGANPESALSTRVAGLSAEARFTVMPAGEPEPAALAVLPPEPPPPVVQPAAAVPPPEPPVVRPAAVSRIISGSFPPDGYILSTEQLAGVSSVYFTWEGRAAEYRFALYRADGEVVVPPSVVPSASFTMQNPRALEPGAYEWEIWEKDRRGRWGESAASRFTVTTDPPAIRKLPTTDQGALYGKR